MPPQLIAIIALYLAAAVLPVLGLLHALGRVQGDLRRRVESTGLPADDREVRLADLTALTRGLNPHTRRKGLLRDLALVATGLACGAVASIWSLFI